MYVNTCKKSLVCSTVINKNYIINNCLFLLKSVGEKPAQEKKHGSPFLAVTEEAKRHCKLCSPVFFIFSFFLLFYSRKNIKHSENIFHILRAIQNVLHGFSSWNLFFSFFLVTYPSSQWRLYMHNYKNKTYKQERGEVKGGRRSTLGEPRGDETFKDRGRKRSKTGSHNRERQRERQL